MALISTDVAEICSAAGVAVSSSGGISKRQRHGLELLGAEKEGRGDEKNSRGIDWHG